MLALLLLATVAEARRPAPPPPPPLAEVAGRLLGAALISDEAYDELGELCDTIGHRLAGSPGLERAIAWGLDEMKADGLVTRAEPVTVPVWVRGEERAAIVAPREEPLRVLALGGSVGTPKEGLEAEVVVVSSWADLEAKKDRVAGRIVLYDVPFTGYGETVAYRGRGASAAARHGAVAVLVRSVTPTSLDTPHTGAMGYAADAPKIPAAAVTVEAATHIRRLVDRGETVRVRLSLGAETRADAPSANVIGELRGRERPDEVVVLACHLDSWDVGQGAQDDGAGCAIVMGAADLVASLPWRPRRTVRVVLYTNEENGLAGGTTYATQHEADLGRHFAALEADTGAGQPLGFRVAAGPTDHPESKAATAAAIEALRPVVALLDSVGATALAEGYGGADIGPLTDRGVLSLGLSQDTSDYWPIHHTEADTFEKIDPVLLARNVATTAVMAWALAEMPEPPAPRVTPPPTGAR